MASLPIQNTSQYKTIIMLSDEIMSSGTLKLGKLFSFIVGQILHEQLLSVISEQQLAQEWGEGTTERLSNFV